MEKIGKRGENRMNHRIAIILALIIVIAALAPAIAIAASPIISIDSYTVDVSSNVTVPVKITNASAVAGGALKITFNPAIVNVRAVTSGHFGTPTSNINNANGSVHIAASIVTAVGMEEAVLANITFEGISRGSTALNIQNATLNFEDGTTTTPETSDGSIYVYVPSNNNDSPTPTPTPTPSPDTETDTGATTGTGSSTTVTSETASTDADTVARDSVSLSSEPVSISIGAYATEVNSNVTVPVEILNARDIAAGGSVNITFNPSIITVQAILPGDFGIPVSNIDGKNGFVYIACASPTAVGKDTAKLAIVRFKGISKGLTSLDIQDASLNDEEGNLITLETTLDGKIDVRTSSPPPTATNTTTESHASNSFAIIAIVIVACLVLVGGAIVLALYRKRRT